MTMGKIPRARYTSEFKVQAVAMAESDGLGIAETARRLSVSPKTLANWVKQFRSGASPAGRRVEVSAPEAELSRLRKENAQLRMECEILKKAAAYFAKESL